MPDWHEQLSALVHDRHPALVGYAYLLCGSTKEAEDLVQEALVKVYVRRSTPEPGGAEGYVRRAILTLYLDTYRRRRRWSGIRHLVGRQDTEDGMESSVTDQVDVATALDALTPRQRSCVVLRYYDDLTVPQVASRLGCTPGTVKRHLFDAHAVLERRLGPLDDGGSDQDQHVRFHPPTGATPRVTPAPAPLPPTGASSTTAPSTGSPS